MKKTTTSKIIIDRSPIVDQNFIERVSQSQFPTALSSTSLEQAELSSDNLLSIFESQCQSRHLDLLAREYKRLGKAFYTIGSSGHEGNAAIAAAFTPNDMAFLHYRSGAFMLQRAKQVSDCDMAEAILLSLFAAKDDPIAGGRHKVFGSVALNVPPQTSTIASHLPKAVGAAALIHRANRLGLDVPLDKNSVVLCSFGDASMNHSTALGAFNQAQWIAYQHFPLPLIFICEDNGLGISVETPPDWVQHRMSAFADWEYLQADGLNCADVYLKAKQAEAIAREHKKPVFLHMKCVRLLGHAGTDVESQYRDLEDIEADELNDPLLHTARLLVENKLMSAVEVVARYQEIREKIIKRAESLVDRKPLASAHEIMESIIPAASKAPSFKAVTEERRTKVFTEHFSKLSTPLNMAQHINYALTDILLKYPNTIVFGEDVATKGGVYRVTADLQQRFGPARVFDSILDEQSILGHAIGHAQNGFIPIPEIQYLAYLHNAEDQLRGEAATLPFFSNGQLSNPMVIRIASLAYQKGFGGHFHNDNSIAVLRDIPGIIVACPSSGADAAMMLRECVRLADEERRVVVFLEPIALYMEKDLHKKNDGLWSSPYPALDEGIAFGEIGVDGDSDEHVIMTYGNGCYLSQQAKKDLQEKHNIDVKVIDLRWLVPLNERAICEEIKSAKNILIVDECRNHGSISEALAKMLLSNDTLKSKNIQFLTAEDSFITLGDSWGCLLPSKKSIVERVTNSQ